MQSIYDPATLHEFISRIDKLTPTSQRQWGKMDVAQMMAHCCVPIESALGDTTIKTPLMGRIMGPIFKSVVTNEKPFKNNSPSMNEFIITDTRDFNKEKTRLSILITRLSNSGADALHNRRHPFFGKLTSGEWSNAMVKHLDHHLRQFGV